MSSNIEIIRVCEQCTDDFVAKKTTTRFCSHKCNNAAYKQRLKEIKMKQSNAETGKSTQIDPLNPF